MFSAALVTPLKSNMSANHPSSTSNFSSKGQNPVKSASGVSTIPSSDKMKAPSSIKPGHNQTSSSSLARLSLPELRRLAEQLLNDQEKVVKERGQFVERITELEATVVLRLLLCYETLKFEMLMPR
jgi:hypothetical protein